MKNTCFLLLFVGAALMGCSRPSFDAAAEQSSLLKRDAEWAEATSNGKDIEKIISYWTDDALIVPPGQPLVEGKRHSHVRDGKPENPRIQNSLEIGKGPFFAGRQASLYACHE
jgi:hypothetical protein